MDMKYKVGTLLRHKQESGGTLYHIVYVDRRFVSLNYSLSTMNFTLPQSVEYVKEHNSSYVLI